LSVNGGKYEGKSVTRFPWTRMQKDWTNHRFCPQAEVIPSERQVGNQSGPPPTSSVLINR